MTDVWGRPEIPPAKKSKGEILTRFDGYIEQDSTTAKGLYKLIVMVPKTEKYKATRAVDRQGVMLHFEVYEPDEATMMANYEAQIEAMLGAEEDGGGDDG